VRRRRDGAGGVPADEARRIIQLSVRVLSGASHCDTVATRTERCSPATASNCKRPARVERLDRGEDIDVMNRSLLALMVITACSSSEPVSPDAAPPPPEGDMPIDPRFQPLVDQIQTEQAQLGAPGVAVLVMENGTITFAHGFGVKNPDGTNRVDAGTLFRIGSVTKMLTTTALLELEASGKVALEDPVTRAIPGFHVAAPAGGEATITVRHLLTHSSGLADYLGDLNTADQSDALLSSYTTGQFSSIEYQMDPAGSMWNYSNPNFILAGLTLENVGGAPYRTAMQERVLTPLGMHRTLWRGDDVIADGNYAYGLTKDASGARLVEAPDTYDSPWARPAGFAFSTVYDLARFVTFLEDGNASVLPDAERMAMQTPQINMQLGYGDLQNYGYALFVDKGFFLHDGFHATTLVSHGGDIPGFAADVYYVPSTKFAIIVLANTDGAHFTDSVVLALENYAGLSAPTTAPSFPIDPTTFDALAGSYQDDFNVGRVTIANTTDGLTISMPDVDAAHVPYDAKLVAAAPDNFILTIQGTQQEISFLRDSAGNPQYIRHRAFVAKRTTTTAAHAVDASALRWWLAENALHDRLVTPRHH
jgi:CubicO group peptidase (beta-lactamase class C family)